MHQLNQPLLKTLSILLKNVLIFHYMGVVYYTKLYTLYLPLLQRYNSGVSPSPQQILDPPLVGVVYNEQANRLRVYRHFLAVAYMVKQVNYVCSANS